MAAGRPTKYTQELGDRVCGEIARGVSLVKICDTDDSLPAPSTVYAWLRTHDAFQKNYTRAKEDQADYLAEQTLEISDDESIDPQHKKYMVDTRKWLASKFKPKKYGDRVTQELTGSVEIQSIERVIRK